MSLPLHWETWSRSQREEWLSVQLEFERRARTRTISRLYPDSGPLRRELYPRHLEFFAAGRVHRERAFIAANRIGKTWGVGAYETTLHLTGDYPSWWEGKRFAEPVRWWASGKTNETTRDIVQAALLGAVTSEDGRKVCNGQGMIPGDLLSGYSWKAGVTDLVDSVSVRHKSGGLSTLGLKAYAQGRGAFEGAAQHGIWLDEEPDMSVYIECLTRTMTTDGMVICTFTPLEGMSDVVMAFLHPDTAANSESQNVR